MSTTTKEEFITPQGGEILRVMRVQRDGIIYELQQLNGAPQEDGKPITPNDKAKPFAWQNIAGKIRIWRQPEEKILVRTAVITEQEF